MRKREIIDRCEVLEKHVRSRRLATDEELAEYRPAKGSRDELFAWVYFYAQLIRFCGRIETKELDGSEADGVILAALHGDPLAVTLASGTVVQVHAKSLHALLHFQARDRRLLWLTSQFSTLRESQDPADLALLERVGAELAYQNLLLAWMATHEGPGLPYDSEPWSDEQDARPELPPHIAALEPWDVLRIHRAFIERNSTCLQALERLTDPPKGDAGGRPSWSVFIGQLSVRYKVDAKRLMRDHSLVKLLAIAKLTTPSGPDVDEAVG